MQLRSSLLFFLYNRRETYLTPEQAAQVIYDPIHEEFTRREIVFLIWTKKSDMKRDKIVSGDSSYNNLEVKKQQRSILLRTKTFLRIKQNSVQRDFNLQPEVMLFYIKLNLTKVWCFIPTNTKW